MEEDDIFAEGITPESEVERHEQQQLVYQAVLGMEWPDREIFLRHYYYFQTTARIADEMGMSLSAVKARLSRGREKLGIVLTKIYLNEGDSLLWDKIPDFLDGLAVPDIELKETQAVSADRIKEIAMNRILSETKPRRPKLRPATVFLAATLALALSMAAFAIRYWTGYANTEGMSRSEIEAMLSNTAKASYHVIEPDGTDHYFDSQGNPAMGSAA